MSGRIEAAEAALIDLNLERWVGDWYRTNIATRMVIALDKADEQAGYVPPYMKRIETIHDVGAGPFYVVTE